MDHISRHPFSMSPRALLLFVVLSVLWGIPYLLIKVAVAEVSVPFLVFARAAIGALVLFPFAVMQGGFAQVRRHWRPVAGFAIVEMIIPWGLIVHGEQHLNSSTTGLLVAATPIIAVVVGRFSKGAEQVSLKRINGLFLGFGGVAVLAAPYLGGDLTSVIEILLASFCYAIGSMIAAQWLGDVPAVPMTAACLVLVSLAYTIPASTAWPVWPSTPVSVAIVTLGVACTAVAFASFFLLIREVGSERAVIITYTAPAISVAAGIALLDESLDSMLLTAFVLILCGSYLATDRASGDRLSEREGEQLDR
jgi:drug/metabolite transporter (DMT)-like permease